MPAVTRLLTRAALAANPRAEPHRAYYLGALAVRRDGAVVVARNGSARVRTPGAHAEIRVLRKAGWGATVYVVRITRSGAWAMAKPCPTCAAILRAKGARVVYSTGPNQWSAT